MATQSEYASVASAIRTWAVNTQGEWKESFIEPYITQVAKIAVDTLDAIRAKEVVSGQTLATASPVPKPS